MTVTLPIYNVLRVFVFAFLISFSVNALAESVSDKHPTSLEENHPQVQMILDSSIAPEGVVFEIETLDAVALQNLTPFVLQQINLIKAVFPEVDIAVVSHGVEEFALLKQSQSQFAGLHQLLNDLVAQKGVSVHVCGAVAGLKALAQEDFPDFVSFSASGMAQVNDYKALGYTIVNIQTLAPQQRKQLFEQPEQFIP
jgi:intracellular sulfur oxidation DsrE/DsrF family protein